MQQHIDCPNCARPVPWDGETRGPAQVLKCPFCSHRFSPTDPQASLVKSEPADVAPEEVWELDVDGDDPFGTPEALLDDFDFMDESSDDLDGATRPDYQAPSLEEIMGVSGDSHAQVPDLPDLPNPVSNIIKMSGSNMNSSNWGDLLDDVDDSTPALPPLDFELKEADPNALAPQQTEQVGQTKRPKFIPKPAPSAPPEAPVLFTSKPPPGSMQTETKKESLSDLLESFVEDEEDKDEETRYYIQRNDKDFGPFSEAEILRLIESRKLKGDEMVRESESVEWLRLEDSPDFRATIEVLRKVPVRTGWERQQRRETPSSPVAADFDSFEVSPISEPPADEAGPARSESILRGGPTEAPVVEEAPKPAPSKRNLLLASIAGGLVLLLGVIWITSGPSKKIKKPKKNRMTEYKLILSDSFPAYKKVLQQTMRSFQKGSYSVSWFKIRHAYHLLDSYGDDRSIRGGAEQVFRKLMARKKGKNMMMRIALLRAISRNDNKTIATFLGKLEKKLSPKHPEWGFVLARAQELRGQYSKAKETYSILLKKHRKHIRAILGLYRVHQALNKPYQASSYLLRAFRAAPKHLPSQLAALRYAVERGTWLTFRPKIRQNVQRIIRDNHYTQGGLAQWYVLQANKHWKLRQTSKAIYRIEQAITLSPQIRSHQYRRIQFLLWSNKPYQARQAIKGIEGWKKQPQLVIWDFQALLRNGTQNQIVKYLEPLSESAAKNLQAKYLYYYLLALSYLNQKETSSAISSCLSATQLKGANMPKPFAHLLLLRLYNKEKSWAKLETQLKALESMGYTSADTDFYTGTLALGKDELEKAKSTAQQMRKRFPTMYQSHLLAALVAKKEKRVGRTIRLYRKALLYHPKRPSPLLLQMGNFLLQNKKLDQAYTLYKRYEKLLGTETMPCDALRQKFQTMVGLKRCTELLAISIKHCKHFSLHMLRGQCSEMLTKNDKAEEEYLKARRLVPNTVDPIEALANLKYKLKKYKEAKKLYTKLQSKDSDKALYLLRLLKLLRREQLNRKAYRLLRRNINKFEKDFPLQVEAVYVYATNRRRYWKARKLLKQLKEDYTSSKQVIQLHYAQANLYSRLGKTKKAIQEYSAILEKDDKQVEAYYLRGKMFLKRRKYRQCYNDTSKLLKLVPNHPDEDAIKLWRDTCRRKM